MYIPLFSGHQDDVFIPAILLALVAAVLVALPLVFAPLVRRMRGRRALIGVLATGVALALIGAVVLAAPGFARIAQQRASVQAQIESRYGLELKPDEIAKLVNGDTLKSLPETGTTDSVRLAGTGRHYYVLIGTPKSSTKTLELPRS